MAEIGNHPGTPGTSYEVDIGEGSYTGFGIVVSGLDATPNHMGFYASTVNATANVYAAIYQYNSGGNDTLVVNESSATSVSAQGWYTVPFSSASLTSGNTYYCVIVADITFGNIYVSGVYGAGFSSFVADYGSNWWTGSGWAASGDPTPGTTVDVTNIYLDYTAGAGGIAIPVVRHHLRNQGIS